MKCENCEVNVGQEFAFAIKNNQCPACGKSIMMPEKLASFLSLQSLLRSNFKELDVERIASLVVANFNISQIFKEELPKAKTESIIKVEPEASPSLTDEVSEDDVDSDEEFKKKQMAEGKAILQNMRDQVLNEAIADQWGLGNANAFTEAPSIREIVDTEKKKQSQENIVSGNRGSFRRSE